MRYLSGIGRIFYGLSMAVLGVLTVYDHDFPYFMIPFKHPWISDHVLISYISGALLVLAGACIVFKKMVVPVSLLLGTVLLLVFVFYFVPYQLKIPARYMHFGTWENSAKELALAGGAFVVAGAYSAKNENLLIRFLAKLIPLGAILYAISIISFGIDHFLFAKESVDYVPSWVPAHLFWLYFCGVALLASGIAIIVNIQRRLAATLLGAMIVTWFLILHMPRVVVSPAIYMSSELASAFLALAYGGIAWVIAGGARRRPAARN